MIKSETIGELAKALAMFQMEVKQPKKDAENPFFKSKYVPLDNVVDAISECAPKHGLSFTQWPAVHPENGRIGVTTMILHSSGEWMEFDPLYMNSEKDTAQGAGSVITYARRYSLSAAFGLASEVDDDGNEASGDPNKPSQAPKTQNKSNAQLDVNGPVDEPKARVLYAKMKDAGYKAYDEVIGFLGYTISSTKEVQLKDFKKLADWLDTKKASGN